MGYDHVFQSYQSPNNDCTQNMGTSGLKFVNFILLLYTLNPLSRIMLLNLRHNLRSPMAAIHKKNCGQRSSIHCNQQKSSCSCNLPSPIGRPEAIIDPSWVGSSALTGGPWWKTQPSPPNKKTSKGWRLIITTALEDMGLSLRQSDWM